MDRNNELIVYAIDHNHVDILELDNDTLFMNIYHFWCCLHFVSSNYSWGEGAAANLRKNIIKKWPSNDFSNVYLFLELISHRTKQIDPTYYFYQSEDYFELLMSLKSTMDRMICDRHINVNVNVNRSVRKCIR